MERTGVPGPREIDQDYSEHRLQTRLRKAFMIVFGGRGVRM